MRLAHIGVRFKYVFQNDDKTKDLLQIDEDKIKNIIGFFKTWYGMRSVVYVGMCGINTEFNAKINANANY